MASPFSIFRKYQKTLLVVAGVVLMFVFVIGDSISQWVGSAAQRGPSPSGMEPTDVAVRWNDGKLTNRELSLLVTRRRVLQGFLERIYQLGTMSAAEAGADPRSPLQVELVAGVGQPDTNIEQSVVQTRLFADAARRAGMVISDENIRQYLMEVGRGRVSAEEMRRLLANSQFRGGRIPTDYMFDALRQELLARNYIAGYQFAFDTVLPQQRWADWLRVNDRVVAEVAAVPSSKFIVDVPDPSEDELVAFFEKYKDREPMPDVVDNTRLPSPTPGFATPRRVRVHYLVADFNDFVTRLADEVTDEEIEDYYEENKSLFVRADSGFAEQQMPAEGEIEEEQAPAEEPSDAQQDADQAERNQADSSESPTEEDASAKAGETPESSAQDVTEEQQQTESAPESPPASPEEESQPTESPRDGSDEEAAEADEPVDSSDSGEGNGKLEIRGQSPDDQSAESANAVAETNTEASAETSEETANASAAVDAVEGSENATDQPNEADEPVEYQPLDEVREEIRLLLAQQKVTERTESLMKDLYTQLQAEYTSWEAEVFDAEEAGEDPPPPPPSLVDLAPLAEEHGLVFNKTGLLSYLQLQETPIGESRNPERFGRAPMAAALIVELKQYQPAFSYDLDGNRYLSVKVEDIPRKVPELEEVREEVVRAWKLDKAAELALDHAQELAEQAEDSGLTLDAYFADNSEIEVVKTDPFGWLTSGAASQMTGQVQFFRMSEPYGVQAAGPAFMRKVYSLESGKVGAVLNHDRSIAYVVRVAERLQSHEELRETFLLEADFWPGLTSMNQFHNRQAAQAVVRDFLAANGVEWVRPPDQPEQEEV